MIDDRVMPGVVSQSVSQSVNQSPGCELMVRYPLRLMEVMGFRTRLVSACKGTSHQGNAGIFPGRARAAARKSSIQWIG